MHRCCAGEQNLNGSTSGSGFLRPVVRAFRVTTFRSPCDSFIFDTKYYPYRVHISAPPPHLLTSSHSILRNIVMAQAHITAKKQHGQHQQSFLTPYPGRRTTNRGTELQQQYTTYKNSLQQLAQKIGDVEQETEEHKCVPWNAHRSRSPLS